MLGAECRAGHQGGKPSNRMAWSRWASIAMRRAGLAMPALLAGGIAVAPVADAAEWMVSGNLSQRFQAESNPDLEENGEPLYGTTTAVGIDVTALTPTTEWHLGTGASVSFFAGGADDSGLDGAYPNLAASVSHDGKYFDTGASFGIDLQPAAFAQPDTNGVDAGDATQLTVRLGANAAMALDQVNALSLGVSGRIVRFTSGETSLSPTTTYGTSLSWGHTLSADTQTSLTFGVRRFISKGDDDEKSLSFNLSAGVGHRVNRRLAFDASLGVSATRTTEAGEDPQEQGLDPGVTGSLGIDWQPRADTQFSFALSHGLEPSEEGSLQTVTALGAGVNHAFNSWISGDLNLLLQYLGPTPGSDGGSEDEGITVTLSPGLAFSLTRDVALRLGYSLRMERDTGSDMALSNGVFLTLTHSFGIYP